MADGRTAPAARAACAAIAAAWSLLACAPHAPPRATAPQNPSPMVETTRPHERLAPAPLAGIERSFPGPAGGAVELLVPDAAPGAGEEIDVVVHFHGAAWLPRQAVAGVADGAVTAVVNLGAGSTTYDRAFSDPAAFDSLLAGVTREAADALGTPVRPGRVTLTAFSAGHGAVRAILREPRHFAAVDAVLLLDGLHTSYVPGGTPLADGGALDTANLAPFAELARTAVRGEKRFVLTHSEIFPGTFASTTETADWLLDALELRRTPVLRPGPRGMQQLSEARAGGFELRGFAGNTAPDHVDHLHALPELLAATLREPEAARSDARPDTRPLEIGETFTMESAVLGETRRINVYAPPAWDEEPGAPRPVLYMPDGGLGEDFLHVAGLLQISVLNGTMRPFLLVGIENTQRRRDLTGPTAVAEDRAIAPEVGGSAAFRRFLREELIPAVERGWSTTGERAIVGESLAGLFVVETMLLEPDLFDAYVAFDPSLWWNAGGLLEEAAERLGAAGREPRSVYLASSSEPELAALTARLAERLERSAPSSWTVRYRAMPEETHATIYHPAALRAFRLLFRPPDPGR